MTEAVIPSEMAIGLLVNEAIDSAVLAIASVYLFGKMTHQSIKDPSGGLIVTLLLARPAVPQVRGMSSLHKIRLKADY